MSTDLKTADSKLYKLTYKAASWLELKAYTQDNKVQGLHLLLDLPTSRYCESATDLLCAREIELGYLRVGFQCIWNVKRHCLKKKLILNLRINRHTIIKHQKAVSQKWSHFETQSFWVVGSSQVIFGRKNTSNRVREYVLNCSHKLFSQMALNVFSRFLQTWYIDWPNNKVWDWVRKSS